METGRIKVMIIRMEEATPLAKSSFCSIFPSPLWTLLVMDCIGYTQIAKKKGIMLAKNLFPPSIGGKKGTDNNIPTSENSSNLLTLLSTERIRNITPRMNIPKNPNHNSLSIQERSWVETKLKMPIHDGRKKSLKEVIEAFMNPSG